MFTENQYLVEFSTIVKVSFQQTKRGFFHTLLHRSFSIPCDFILKSIIWRLSSWKTIIVRISWIRVLNYSCIRVSNKLYTPKVIVQDVPKRNIFVKLTFLGSTSFQIRKKLQKLFSDKLTSCDLKIVFTHPLESKTFPSSKISYLRCYFQDMFTRINVVGAILPIMVRLNTILKTKFVHI